MYSGQITKLFFDKKCGLIQAKNGAKIHFHEHCLWNVQFAELTEGQDVEFEIQSSRKGNQGFHIRLCP